MNRMYKKRHSLVQIFIKPRVADTILENERHDSIRKVEEESSSSGEEDYPPGFRPPGYVGVF